MAERRPMTTPYNALARGEWAPYYGGYWMAGAPAVIPPGDPYAQYLRAIGGGLQPQIAPAPGLMEPPPQQPAPEAPEPPRRWRSLSDDEDADIAGLAPTNALAAYGRRRF